jgi:hypothetical protein
MKCMASGWPWRKWKIIKETVKHPKKNKPLKIYGGGEDGNP